MKKKLKLFTSIFSYLTLFGFAVNVVAAVPTAAVAGCNYGLLDINTVTLANTAKNRLDSMGFATYQTNAPSTSVLKSTVNGRPFLKANVVYLAGHGDQTTITFKGCTSSQSGLNMGKEDVSGRVGIRQYDFSDVKLVVLQACETAKDATGNITKLFNTLGAKAAIGWKGETNVASGESWAGRFWDKLKAGSNIAQAKDYADSFTYLKASIKTSSIYGDFTIKLWPATSVLSLPINIPEFSLNNKFTREYETNIIVTNENILDNIYSTIEKSINKTLNINDYILNVVTGDDKTIYDLILNINGVSVELGYTIFVENNVITNIFDNTQNMNINEIKQNIIAANLDVNNMNLQENDSIVYDFQNHKLYKYTDVVDFDNNGAKEINTIAKEIIIN